MTRPPNWSARPRVMAVLTRMNRPALISEIARWARVSKPTVRRYLEELADAGRITVDKSAPGGWKYALLPGDGFDGPAYPRRLRAAGASVVQWVSAANAAFRRGAITQVTDSAGKVIAHVVPADVGDAALEAREELIAEMTGR